MANLANFIIDRLKAAGIKTSFGVPGDYILKFYNMLHSSMGIINCTTEANAGFAADAYARINGLGCVVVTYGVGGFNVINSVACAFAEKSPLIVISGAPGLKERNDKVLLHHMIGHFDCQAKMFSHITCAQAILNDMDRAGHDIDRVITAAKHYKQPVYIEIPRDQTEQAIRYDAFTRGTPISPKSDEQNLAEAIKEVKEWLAGAIRPVIWAGVEVSRFDLGKKLVKWAEKNHIPFATTVLGKSVFNETHPLCLGVYCEALSSDELKSYMADSDCFIMLGCLMTDMNLGLMPLKCVRRNTISVTTNHLKIRNHSFIDVNFSDFIEALTKVVISREFPTLPRKEERVYHPENGKITADRFFQKINSILTPRNVIIADIGDALFGALGISIQDSHRFLSDAFYASMGFAVPAAVGVQAADPECRPIVLVGDGAFQMTGLEFSTLVRMKSNAIVFVINNNGYMTERLIMDGSFNDLHPWNYEKTSDLVGGVGYVCKTEPELEEAINQALKQKQPSIINVMVNDYSSSLKKLFKVKS